MEHGIFTLSEKAYNEGMDWDKAIYENEIEIVEEFEDYEKAVEAFENGGYDPDLYIVG